MKDFDPSQARDDSGKWDETGAGGGGGKKPSKRRSRRSGETRSPDLVREHERVSQELRDAHRSPTQDRAKIRQLAIEQSKVALEFYKRGETPPGVKRQKPSARRPGESSIAYGLRTGAKESNEMTNEVDEPTNPVLEVLNTLRQFISDMAAAWLGPSNQTDLEDTPIAADSVDPNSAFEVKEVNGKHRWVLFSSSAYKDRDNEIVSQKAQEADTLALEAAGDHGVLRWWHVGTPAGETIDDWRTYKAGPGLDLGVCDYSAMHDRIRIESGTFYDEGVGAAIKEVANKLTVSLGFSHPLDEPNGDGVFDNIHTFERSLLPAGIASNLFVDVPLILSEKERNMEAKKRAALEGLIGKEAAGHVLAQAEATQKEADAQGVTFKELDEETPAETAAETTAPAETPAADPNADKVGDMTRGELKEYIGKCMQAYDASKSTKESEALTTFKEESAKTINQVVERVNVHGKKLKALEGDLPAGVKRGYRASQADETINPKITEKEVAAQQVGPRPDFFDWAVNGGAPAPVGGTPPPAIN